ncbi:MAG: helix-turn-helix domain-containing protein [Prevotella sp.]|nr:helix-turn-helix domain-containing protein [Prevotella sp.]MCF0208054.1 helix-turn-helix domain-containing protein [Bacteroidaceae bacterium]
MNTYTMQTNINERVMYVLDKKYDKSSIKLEKHTGFSKNSFNSQKARGNFSLDLIMTILNYNPDISAEWLMRGNGSMYIQEQQPDNTDKDNLIQQMQERIDDYRELLGLRKKEAV